MSDLPDCTRLALVVIAAVLLVGCNTWTTYRTPSAFSEATGMERDAKKRDVSVRAVVNAFGGRCWLDLYFSDGSKLYIDNVDLRICVMPEAK